MGTTSRIRADFIHSVTAYEMGITTCFFGVIQGKIAYNTAQKLHFSSMTTHVCVKYVIIPPVNSGFPAQKKASRVCMQIRSPISIFIEEEIELRSGKATYLWLPLMGTGQGTKPGSSLPSLSPTCPSFSSHSKTLTPSQLQRFPSKQSYFMQSHAGSLKDLFF